MKKMLEFRGPDGFGFYYAEAKRGQVNILPPTELNGVGIVTSPLYCAHPTQWKLIGPPGDDGFTIHSRHPTMEAAVAAANKRWAQKKILGLF